MGGTAEVLNDIVQAAKTICAKAAHNNRKEKTVRLVVRQGTQA